MTCYYLCFSKSVMDEFKNLLIANNSDRHIHVMYKNHRVDKIIYDYTELEGHVIISKYKDFSDGWCIPIKDGTKLLQLINTFPNLSISVQHCEGNSTSFDEILITLDFTFY